MMRFIGGVLLVVGTAVGGGILALPLVCAQYSVPVALALIFGFWIVTLFAASFLLEASVWLPEGASFSSMAELTLGRLGKGVTWCVTAILLYALLCAYISGGGDVLYAALTNFFHRVPWFCTATLITLFFAVIVYRGVNSVDFVNRFFMCAKFLLYFLLIVCIVPHVDLQRLAWHMPIFTSAGMMIIATAFGYALIVPSLRVYFHSDVKKIKQALFVGSLITLIIYALWMVVTIGVMNDAGLASMMDGAHTLTALSKALTVKVNSGFVFAVASIFVSICTATSFLGVSLSLSDFLADGLKIKKSVPGKVLVTLLTFLPPLLIVLSNHGIFVAALRYAGVLAVVLMVLLPALMVYSGRYVKHLAARGEEKIYGGRFVVTFVAIIGIALVVWGVVDLF